MCNINLGTGNSITGSGDIYCTIWRSDNIYRNHKTHLQKEERVDSRLARR